MREFIAFADLFKATRVQSVENTNSLTNALISKYGMYHKVKEELHELRLLLLVSHFEESLHWLATIDTPFIIASKTIEDSRILHVPVNRGNEVSSYLLYIVEYYEYLPEYTLFLHGHDSDWHQLYNLHYIVHHLKLNTGYHNINNYLVNNRYIETNEYMRLLQSIWLELFQEELGDLPEGGFREKCCAQFAVHRDRIRLRSKAFYEQLYQFVISDKQDDAHNVDGYHSSMSYVMEFIWHYVFGEPAIMNYPDGLYLQLQEDMLIYL
jgi:hypothetical protein